MTSSALDASVAEVPDWREIRPLELTPILSAALDAFYENGFHGASVRDIAKRVGVTVPALYYHHENKEGLLLALLELSTRDVLARADAADAAGGDDPVQRLANVIYSIVLRLTNRARMVALESEVRYLSADNRQHHSAIRKNIEELVLAIVKDGNRAGVFSATDAAETTRAVLGMCQSIPRWYHAEGKLSPESVSNKYVAIALKAVGCGATVRPIRAPRRRKS
ncbi:TetR/AcrR family transcriptional regulator [Rhodococcus sp. NPDC059234]|uniref:TetR/AcrR family transcriptional regulator n=1 Tax=Rhodococcus sp. NPDC059234 TaxID=3346781 RepID=UPI00366FB3A3